VTAAELDDGQVVANAHARIVGPVGEGMESPRLPDAVLAIALAVVGLTDLWINLDHSTHYGPDLSAAAVVLVATLALAWRRRYPFQTLCVVAGVIAVPELAGTLTFTLWGHFLPLVVAAYSVARWCGHRLAGAGAAIVSGVVAVVLLRVPATGGVDNIPFAVVPVAAVMVTGRVLRRREARTVALATRAHQLEATRDAEVTAAVAEERSRIARDLHDVVAHCVSVMIVQAGASEALLEHSPDRARIPLREVQKTGQQAIAELTRMLGVLRGPRHDVQALPSQLEPQPGVSEVPMLFERLASSGLDVRLSIFGDARPLPPGTDLTLYRVTQEALTNTLKHAGPGASARVKLQYLPHTVEIEVTDTGSPSRSSKDTALGSTVPARRTGHGLIGMAERVSVFGGSFECGHQPDGGYRVHVTLPAEET
jgi:signal transduction histidine kinase